MTSRLIRNLVCVAYVINWILNIIIKIGIIGLIIISSLFLLSILM